MIRSFQNSYLRFPDAVNQCHFADCKELSIYSSGERDPVPPALAAGALNACKMLCNAVHPHSAQSVLLSTLPLSKSLLSLCLGSSSRKERKPTAKGTSGGPATPGIDPHWMLGQCGGCCWQTQHEVTSATGRI